jgi:hypothetical protein
MSNLPVSRDPEYMRKMWGTMKLVTDYNANPANRVIQEVMHDLAPKHNFAKQSHTACPSICVTRCQQYYATCQARHVII